MSGNVCFICQGDVDEGDSILVKERGVRTLLESSRKRKNADHTRFLEGVREVSVHSACKKHYTNPKLIDAYIRRGYKTTAQSAVAGRVRGKVRNFNFREQCFLCGEGLSDKFKSRQKHRPNDKRYKIHKVMKLEVRQKMMNAAAAHGHQDIVERLNNEQLDLVAADAWYHSVCLDKLYKKPSSKNQLGAGRKPSAEIDRVMEKIFSYLEDHSEECQFSIDELLNLVEEEKRPDIRTVKARLFHRYGEDLLYVEQAQKSPVICFRNVGCKTLTDAFYENKNQNIEEERSRIVKVAAEIVLEDIRSVVYDLEHYPPPQHNFLSNAESVVPATLKLFLETVVVKHKKGDLGKWRQKVVSLSHAIIAAARPRSFLSSILIGTSVYLYKRFGSRLLIDLMSSLGFCASYWEAIRFETSCVLLSQTNAVQQPSYCQFVFDNADCNVNTLDGLNTFHSMGGIQCITPQSAMASAETMKRMPICSSAEIVSGSNTIQLLSCIMKDGLKNITIYDLNITNDIQPSFTDIIWMYGKWGNFPDHPGWNGFMVEATKNADYDRSAIIYLPFINAPPSDVNTVYTSLRATASKCQENGQKTCVVTFDQPLYIKAMDIVHSGDPELHNVIVRLGGFHLMMSFMGCIGTIMAGSGLKELLSIIYAPNSVDKMLTGHAYGRAVRAHILVHNTLASLIWDMVQLSEEEIGEMEMLLRGDRSRILNENLVVQSVRDKFRNTLEKLQQRGPTSKLWVMYFKMVSLMKQFIEAERMGNWKLHLVTTKKMLPFFHAAGHLPYAKSAHIYIQDMLTLEEKMDPNEFDHFTRDGYFTIRRSEKFWSGIWSDMTIEQTLMRSSKVKGGLTGGRGFSESVLAKWTQGNVNLQYVCDALETYCHVAAVFSEQHVDASPTRVARDDADSRKLKAWFQQHFPFPDIDVIMSLSSGVVGGEQVNCHLAQEIGMVCMSKMIGQNFHDLKLKRTDKVVTLAQVTETLKVGSQMLTAVDPTTLFQRICIAKQSDDDLKHYFTHELTPYPLSLFNDAGLRKGTKSQLFKAFKPFAVPPSLENKIVVVDGGFLLHKVVWDKHESFGAICKKYASFVNRHYGSTVIVVFDGYPSEANRRGTKSSERARRSKVRTSADIMFDESTLPSVSQEKFLGNETNKSRLIQMLKKQLEEVYIRVLVAEEDADVLIVTTACSQSPSFDTVLVVSEDIDVLVILCGSASNASYDNVYLLKPGKKGHADSYFSTSSYQFQKKHLLLVHAFSGCDTTSTPFGHGKMQLCTLIDNTPALQDAALVFYNTSATPADISGAGEKILLAMYGTGRTTIRSIDELRYHLFVKMSTKAKFSLPRLPPTLDAADQHSYRAFLQVQWWMGNPLDPIGWGWRQDSLGLTPIPIVKEPAPQELLKLVFCGCKKGCTSACTCRKSGLKCTTVCKNCVGSFCTNAPDIELDVNIDNDLADQDNKDSPFNELWIGEEVNEDKTYQPEEEELQPVTSKRSRL